MRSLIFLLLSAWFTAGCSSAADTHLLRRTARVGNVLYPYIVHVPDGYDATRKWPIVLFLHGAGERGKNGRQIEVGLGPALQKIPKRYREFIVVFPQAPEHTRWIGEPAQAAMVALDQTISEMNGDVDRIYLTGLSMGGYGVWHLAIEHPTRFAAVLPVCGGILDPGRVNSVRQLPATIGSPDPYKAAAEKMPRVPIWIFHGEKDPVIPVSESRRMNEELKKLGADVHYTEYPGVDHNSWDRAYAEDELWKWMLAQKRQHP